MEYKDFKTPKELEILEWLEEFLLKEFKIKIIEGEEEDRLINSEFEKDLKFGTLSFFSFIHDVKEEFEITFTEEEESSIPQMTVGQLVKLVYHKTKTSKNPIDVSLAFREIKELFFNFFKPKKRKYEIGRA